MFYACPSEGVVLNALLVLLLVSGLKQLNSIPVCHLVSKILHHDSSKP